MITKLHIKKQPPIGSRELELFPWAVFGYEDEVTIRYRLFTHWWAAVEYAKACVKRGEMV